MKFALSRPPENARCAILHWCTAAVLLGSAPASFASVAINETLTWSSCTFATLCGTGVPGTPVELNVTATLPEGFNLAFSSSFVDIAATQFESITYRWTVGGADRTSLLYPLASSLRLTRTADSFGQRPFADVLGISFRDSITSAGFIDPNYFFYATSNSAGFVAQGLTSRFLTVSGVTPTVPEPSAALLVCCGLLGLGGWVRSRTINSKRGH